MNAETTTADRPSIVWFRRDLRVHDHPALVDAVRTGAPIVPLFVVDPSILGGRFASPVRTRWLFGAVAALRAELERRGAGLVIRVGRPVDVVAEVARDVGAETVRVSRDYTPYGRSRDAAVAAGLASHGVAFLAGRGVLIHEPEQVRSSAGQPYRVFSPFGRAWERLELRHVLPAPDRIAMADADQGPTPDPAMFGVPEGSADVGLLSEPGEPAGRARLEAWLDAIPDHGPAAYHRTRDRLDDPCATSRLSTDLRFGTLSPVEVATRALATDGGGAGSRRFLGELAWRDFYAHLLWHEPRTVREPLDQRYRDLAWERDADALAAWREGRTGYPIVDAAMRQLALTGWMPNRARMIVASFLTKDLLIDWREGERVFMELLVDGDPASNLGNWQWVASIGTDSRSFVRVFNPVSQAKRFDPDGRYVRAWLPELARVPGPRVHEPWTMTTDEQERAGCRVGVDYPAPVVDHAAARVRALARYAEAAASG